MTPTVSFYELSTLSAAQRDALLVRTEDDLTDYLAAVQPVIDAVRQDGDAALVRYALEFDRASIDPARIKATDADFERAFATLDARVTEAIEFAVENIRHYHQAQLPEAMWLNEVRPGVFAGERYTPIESIACYVPRGKGAFPSVVMMTAVPAVVAKVPQIIIVTPPGPDGEIDAATLVAAKISGVTDVYKCGGAQAVAAVAYGTETVPKVAKIVGPGSPYVVAAKRLLAGVIDPGIPAGPSESIVLADHQANPRIAALDLIIESEHGPDSSAFLVTDSRELAEHARAAIPEYWQHMSTQRVEFSATVLGGPRGGVVLAPDFDAAIDFVNDYAPEHLEVLSAEPMSYLGRLHNAGEILLGQNTPMVLGNFVLGPNAVLPTSGAAKTVSPLSVFDYLKRSSIGYVTESGYPQLAKHAHVLATYEGFDGHANAISQLREDILRR